MFIQTQSRKSGNPGCHDGDYQVKHQITVKTKRKDQDQTNDTSPSNQMGTYLPEIGNGQDK